MVNSPLIVLLNMLVALLAMAVTTGTDPPEGPERLCKRLRAARDRTEWNSEPWVRLLERQARLGCWLGDLYLSGGDLAGANLNGANLAGAGLSLANLFGAGLSGADLTGANLTGTERIGVIWNHTTCPDGSSSDDHGDTCEGHLWPTWWRN